MKPPIIILHQPQLGENIGMCARAMLNCGFKQLRLVAPRRGWPDATALAPAADADQVLEAARCFKTIEAAIEDCHRIYAATARPRAGRLASIPATAAIEEIQTNPDPDSLLRTAILFGPEASGLDNDALSHADALIHFPMNPEFSSLNLSQAVLLFGWEWLRINGIFTTGSYEHRSSREPPASKGDLIIFLDRLEEELEGGGFFLTDKLRPTTTRALHALFSRIGASERELNMLHGIITALMNKR